jgi:NADPH:quinone reductase-like Zn-dependent oxidoreductase
MTSNTTMRAWTQSRMGLPSEVLSLDDIPAPTIKSPNEILIRVSRVALHPGTSIIMQLCPFMFRSKPTIPETDFSGTIIAVGGNVTSNLSAGMKVFGAIPLGSHIRAGCGALAEFLVVDANAVVRIPEGASFEMCSGYVVLSGQNLTLVHRCHLSSTQRSTQFLAYYFLFTKTPY